MEGVSSSLKLQLQSLVGNSSTEQNDQPLYLSSVAAPCQKTLLNEQSSVSFHHGVFESNTDAEKSVHAWCKNKKTETQILWIKNIKDLLDSNLIKKTVVKNGEIVETKGDLFTPNHNQTITLVIDFRGMPAEDRIKFNSLYTPPVFIGKQEVKANLEIVSIVDDSLLSGKTPTSKDVWRRIGLSQSKIASISRKKYQQTSSCHDSYQPYSSFRNFFEHQVTDLSGASKSNLIDKKIIIDFKDKDWRKELLGKIKINTDGSTYFNYGLLKKSKRIILKDAPWHDYNFKATLKEIIEKKQYISNGETIKIADNIEWQQINSITDLYNESNINDHFTKIKQNSIPSLFQENSNKVAIINNALWLECFSTTRIDHENKLVTADVFSDWLQDAKVILVTSEITLKQKVQLLDKLKDIGANIPISILDSDDIEKGVSVRTAPPLNTLSKLKVEISDKNITSEIKQVDDQATYFHVSPDSNSNNIFTCTRLKNSVKQTFDVTLSDMFSAITLGKKVVITGLENNILLAKQLELLFTNKLIVNGNIYEVNNNLDLTIVVSKSSKQFLSPIWNQLASSSILPDTTFAEIKSFLQQKYDFAKKDPKLSDKMADQLKELISLINSTPKDEITPKGRILVNEHLFSLVWDEVDSILKNNMGLRLSPDIWYNAVSHVLLQKFAGNREKYYFFKISARYYFTDKKPSLYLNKEGIRKWISSKKEITNETVEECFWQLFDFMPECKHILGKKSLKSISVMSYKEIIFFCLNIASSCLYLAWTILSYSSILSAILWTLTFQIITLLVLYSINRYFSYKPIYEKSKELDDIPKSAPISFEKNKTYFRMLEIIKTNIVECANDNDKLRLQKSLGVSNYNLSIIRSCHKEWTPLDKTIRKTLKYLYTFTQHSSISDLSSNNIEAIKDKKSQEQLAVKITELKYRHENAQTKEEINTINEQLIKILSEILPATMLEANKLMLARIFLENNELNEEDKNFLYELSEKNMLSKLTHSVVTHKINVFMGGPGTGKTRACEEIAKILNPDAPIFFIRGSKDDNTNSLFSNHVPKKNIDGSFEMQSQIGTIEQWANSKSDKPIILYVDEANLVRPEIWDNITTITSINPHIYCHGRRINLTAQHRTIFTCNPDSKDGRVSNDFIKMRGKTTYFQQLPEDFQRKAIVEKYLNTIVESTGILQVENKKEAVSELSHTILSLYQQYRGVLPDHYFTPRDLIDCCSYISFFLKHSKEKLSADEITIPMLNSVIYEAMHQAIGQKTKVKDSWKLPAINCWYNNKFTTDKKIVKSTQKQFEAFVNELTLKYHIEQNNSITESSAQNNNEKEFDFENSLTKKMLYSLYIKFEMLNIEKTSDNLHDVFPCRRILEIIGEAGIGKDKLLNLVSRFYKDKYNDEKIQLLNINAGSRSEAQIKIDIEEAFSKGYTLVFSETNQLPSGTLEGILNSLATQTPAPGFQLFFTVNPADYSARRTMSIALQSRFTTLSAGDFSEDGLSKIANNILKDDKTSAVLSKLHCKLTADLKRHKLPQSPSVDTLVDIAKKLQNKEKSTKNIKEQFEKSYCFFLDVANNYIAPDIWSSEAISNAIVNSSENINENTRYIENITEWLLNDFAKDLNDNIYVIYGSKDGFDIDRNYIFLSDDTLSKSETEQKQIATKLFFKYLWQKKCGGLIDCPVEYNDTATVVYKKWQQHFANSMLQNSNVVKEIVNIHDIFPLNDKEEKLYSSLGEVRQLLLQSIFETNPNFSNVKKMQIIISAKSNDNSLLDLANELITNNINILKSVINININLASKLLNIILSNNKLTTDYIENLLNLIGSYNQNMLEQVLLYIANNISSSCYSMKEKEQLIIIVKKFQDSQYANHENIRGYIQNIINTQDQWQTNNYISQAGRNNSTNTTTISNKEIRNLLEISDRKSNFSGNNVKKPIRYLEQKYNETKKILIDYYHDLRNHFINEIATNPVNKLQANNYASVLKTKQMFGINARINSGYAHTGGLEDLKTIKRKIVYSMIKKTDARKTLVLKVKNKLESLSAIERNKIDTNWDICRFIYDFNDEKLTSKGDYADAVFYLMNSKIEEFVELGLDIINSRYIANFKDYEYAVISRTLLSGILTEEKVLEFIKSIDTSFPLLKISPLFRDLYKNFYAYLLKFSLENIKNNQNRKLSISVINYIIDNKDFPMYLNGISANYLWGIHEEANIVDISIKIKNILDTHYNSCLEKPHNIVFKSFSSNIDTRTDISTTKEMLKIASFPHMENHLSVAKKVDSTYSWDPSNIIDADRIAEKKPFYLSNDPEINQSNVYISSFPYIASMEAQATILYTPTNTYMNLSSLITDANYDLFSKKMSFLSQKEREIYSDFLKNNGINDVSYSDIEWIHSICRQLHAMRYNPKHILKVKFNYSFIHVDIEEINEAFFKKILEHNSIIFCISAEYTDNAGMYKVNSYSELLKLRNFLTSISSQVFGDYFSLTSTEHNDYLSRFERQKIKELHNVIHEPIVTSSDLNIAMSEFIKSLSLNNS